MLQLMSHKARVLDIPPGRRCERIEVGRIVEVRLAGPGRIEARVEKPGWLAGLAGLFGRRPWLPFGRIEPDAPPGLAACLSRADRIRCRVVEVSPRHLWQDPREPEIYVSLWADLPEMIIPPVPARPEACASGAPRREAVPHRRIH